MSITVIDEPRIYLIGRQQVDEHELRRFLADESVERWATDTEVAGQKLVETAGRLCYMSFARPRPGGNAAYVEHLLEVGHGSVLEHAVFNFVITGVSRSFSHELVRHRAGFGFSQLSQRYVDEAKGERGLEVVQPPLVAEASRFGFAEGDVEDQLLGGQIAALWRQSMLDAERRYQALTVLLLRYLDQTRGPVLDGTARTKAAREAARSVLPNATETKVFVTGNARALRHFIETRGAADADAEIRRVAVAMLRLLSREAPNLFGDIVLVEDDAGLISAESRYRKV